MTTPTPLPSGPRAYPRIKFVWGASKVIAAHWRLGLFGFYERIHGFPRSGLALSVRGLLSWAGVLAAAGYLAGAAAVTQWLQRDPYNRIGFADVVSWPWRREHVSRLRGEGLLA